MPGVGQLVAGRYRIIRPLGGGGLGRVWLATDDSPEATVTGAYFKRRRQLRANPQAYDETLQEELLAACAKLSGVDLP